MSYSFQIGNSTMTIGKPERATQDRVIALFSDELKYRYLGDWTDREGNSNVDESLLKDYLHKAGYDDLQISRAIYLLRIEADNHNRGLYENNNAVYKLLAWFVFPSHFPSPNEHVRRLLGDSISLPVRFHRGITSRQHDLIELPLTHNPIVFHREMRR